MEILPLSDQLPLTQFTWYLDEDHFFKTYPKNIPKTNNKKYKKHLRFMMDFPI